MPTHPSLAEKTLAWCAVEFGSNRGKFRSGASGRDEPVRQASRKAAKAAGVALLQAAAAELDPEELTHLGQIAAIIDDDDAIARLEERFGTEAPDTESVAATSPRDRAAFAGRHFSEWLAGQIGAAEIPSTIREWIREGWPDARARGGVTTFYQAFCGALQRAILQDHKSWNELLTKSALDATTWRQWLIRETEATAARPRPAEKKGASPAVAVGLALVVLGGAAAWYWRNEIGSQLTPSSGTTSKRDFATPVVAAKPIAFRSTAPVPAPIPQATPEPPADVVSTAPPPPPIPENQPSSPGESQSKPFAEAGRLMTEAERQLDSANPEKGDVPARSAQDILASLPLAKDVQLAELLNRVAQYWERRNEWAESARIYQRAVKAYEKTPAENANPQLKVVSRWAAVLRRSGRNTEAERLYRMLIQAYEGLGPDLHPEMAAAAHNLAEILATTNRLRDAREYYAQAVAIMAERPSDPRLDHFKDGFTECLRKLGVSEAQIEADTRQILESKSGPNPPSGS